MYKVGICGNFGFESNELCGQTIKTRMILDGFTNKYSRDEVMYIDSSNWRQHPFKLLLNCIKLSINCKNIIILPAHNGIKVFIPLFLTLTKLLNKKLHYIVIGAWLADELSSNKFLLKLSKKIACIYVETKTLEAKLKKLGLEKNIHITPNFKIVNPIGFNELRFEHKQPYKVCTFSRVNFEKGIENAVYAISRINKQYNEEIIKLDIYGPVEKGYEDKFYNIVQEYSSFVSYKGYTDHEKAIDFLKEYYFLLFPTRYYTEGIPGTIIDAFLAGIPVLASRWESCYDIIEEGLTGITYEFKNDNDLYSKLNYAINNKNKVLEMKEHCLEEGKKYTAYYSMRKLTDNLV